MRPPLDLAYRCLDNSPGLDEPEAHELEVTTLEGAPTVANPFINPIHGTLTGEVTIENAAVKGTLGFTPES